MKWSVLCLLLALPVMAFSQDEAPVKVDEHVIFLHKQVESIEKIEYRNDNEELKGKMGNDEESVILENYKGRKGVKVTVINKDGTRETIERSPCTVYKNIGV